MKKIIALILLVVMCFTMVACGGGQTPGGNNTGNNSGNNSGNTGNNNNTGNNKPAAQKATYNVPEGGYDGSEVTITFYHTMGQNLKNVLDRYITKFNEIYPNITIDHQQIGGYDEVRDQINTQLSGNNQPNIAYCYPDHVAMYNVTKKVIPLDNLIDSQIVDEATGGILGLTAEQKADFIQGYYNEGTVFDEAGTMYTMPLSKSTEALYYNKTFFNENNLKVPTTWEEMEQVCAQIQEILKNDSNTANDENYPLGYDSEANWFITMCEQYGSPYTSNDKNDHYLFNNKTNREFVKMFRGWYEKGYVTTQELYGAYTSALFTNADPSKPSCYMCIGSTGGASHQIPTGEDNVYPFEVGVAPIPQADPENPKAISQGPSLCIFSQVGDTDTYDNDQEVVASWLFVKFLCTTPEFQAAFSMSSGYMPVINSAKEIPAYANWLNNANGAANLAALVIQASFAQADSYFVSPAFNGSSKARDQVGKLIQTCFTTPADDVDAMILAKFKEAIDECLAQ